MKITKWHEMAEARQWGDILVEVINGGQPYIVLQNSETELTIIPINKSNSYKKTLSSVHSSSNMLDLWCVKELETFFKDICILNSFFL